MDGLPTMTDLICQIKDLLWNQTQSQGLVGHDAVIKCESQGFTKFKVVEVDACPNFHQGFSFLSLQTGKVLVELVGKVGKAPCRFRFSRFTVSR